MTEKQFHRLIEAQDHEKKAASWARLKNKLDFKEQKTMAKRKSKARRGGNGKIIAVIVALALLVGIFLMGYCASVDGKLFMNGDVRSWRWGGITTTHAEEPENHAPAAYALSEEIELYALPSLKLSCPECSKIAYSETIMKNATCTKSGTRSGTCTSCGFTSSSTIPALGHSCNWTYNSDGEIDEYTCSRCNAITETRDHQHNYVNGVCTACGAEFLGNTVELPEDPVKDGYTFVGWFFDEACTQPYDGRVIYEDTVLYAGWHINVFTVTFDSAGGSDVAAQTVNWNTAATLTTPERIGYIFKGWFMPDGTQYEAQALTEDITLTARWEIIKCTVTFYVGGELYASLTVDYGTMLIQAVVQAGLFSEDVIAYAYMNGDDVGNELAGVKVTDDMTVSANEPTREEKIKGAVNSYWLPATSCALGAVAAGLLLWAIFSGRRKKGKV